MLFRHSNHAFYPVPFDPNDAREGLPPGIYVLRWSQGIGFYFDEEETFTLPKKIYGEIKGRQAKVLSTFFDRKEKGKSTGVLLEGEKGSGKTLLMKQVGNAVVAAGLPVIQVNEVFTGDSFKSLVADIHGMWIFDEFEKVYSGDGQQSDLLTLFDGGYENNNLFIVICNEYSKINYAMKNRPSRFFYSWKYRGVEPSFIREYVEDNIVNPRWIRNAINCCAVQTSLNFDMLQALVEEVNRYDQDPFECVKDLNFHHVLFESYANWSITAKRNGNVIELQDRYKKLDAHPIERAFYAGNDIPYWVDEKEDEDTVDPDCVEEEDIAEESKVRTKNPAAFPIMVFTSNHLIDITDGGTCFLFQQTWNEDVYEIEAKKEAYKQGKAFSLAYGHED